MVTVSSVTGVLIKTLVLFIQSSQCYFFNRAKLLQRARDNESPNEAFSDAELQGYYAFTLPTPDSTRRVAARGIVREFAYWR